MKKTEKCSQARYARTILKVSTFLVKSDTVYWFNLERKKIFVAQTIFDIRKRSLSSVGLFSKAMSGLA